MLLSDPQILLLDEPTNHLDVEMLEWLESWLGRTPCGALIVSHDRVFLDHTVTRILELDPHSQALRSFEGNYSAYLEKRRSEKTISDGIPRPQQDIRRMKADIARPRPRLPTPSAIQFRCALAARNENQLAKGLPAQCCQKGAKKAKSREKKLALQEAEDRWKNRCRSVAVFRIPENQSFRTFRAAMRGPQRGV